MGTPLRIGYIHRSSGESYGGALIDLLRVVERLDRSVVEPRVVLSHGLHHADLFRQRGLDPVPIPLPAVRKAKSLPLLPIALARLTRWISREGIDLLHVNDADDAALAVLAGRLSGVPCVVHTRSEMEPRKFRKLWVHRVDQVFAVSEAVRRAAVAGGVPADRVRVLHSGVSVPSSDSLTAGRQTVRARYQLGSRIVVGVVANLSPVKNPVLFVEMLAILCARHPDIVGMWVGADDHSLRSSLEDRAEGLGIRSKLILPGFQEDPASYLAAMDIVVSTSLQEGFGLTLLEAMAQAKPVVSTPSAGARDIVLNGQTGLVTPTADPESLAKAVLSLIDDPSLAKMMGQAGHRLVVERFSITRYVETLTMIYRTLCYLRAGLSRMPETEIKPDASPGVHEQAIAILTQTGSSDRKVLDLPCGQGALAAALVALGYRPECADIVTTQLRVPGLRCTRTDLNAPLPFPDASFDDWVCLEGIEHVENPHLLVREAYRILRPGGRLIISTPNTLSVKSRYYILRFGYPVHFDLMIKREQPINGGFTVQHVNPISFIELRFLLEEYGFTITRVETNKFEPRHHGRHAFIGRLLVRRRPLSDDNPEEARQRRLLGTRKLLYGEILIVEAVKK